MTFSSHGSSSHRRLECRRSNVSFGSADCPRGDRQLGLSSERKKFLHDLITANLRHQSVTKTHLARHIRRHVNLTANTSAREVSWLSRSVIGALASDRKAPIPTSICYRHSPRPFQLSRPSPVLLPSANSSRQDLRMERFWSFHVLSRVWGDMGARRIRSSLG